MQIPNTPPPEHLKHLKRIARQDPSVVRVGFTATETGEWALMVWLREEADAPLETIERARAGDEVIYTKEPEYQPVARPAYPALESVVVTPESKDG